MSKKVKNFLGKVEEVKAPKRWKSSPDAPTTQLAYITQPEIDMLVKAKDNLEKMVIDLQKQMLENQDAVMDKIILKAAMDFDDINYAKKHIKDIND